MVQRMSYATQRVGVRIRSSPKGTMFLKLPLSEKVQIARDKKTLSKLRLGKAYTDNDTEMEISGFAIASIC